MNFRKTQFSPKIDGDGEGGMMTEIKSPEKWKELIEKVSELHI